MEPPIDIKQAAKLIGLNKFTIYRKAKDGDIPSRKKGGRVFFFRDELIQWVKSGSRNIKKQNI